MKFIHTSDWHLGKNINTASLIEDQSFMLNQIIGIIREEKPEVVFIAGDIYDRSIPPAAAVKLFDNFLNITINEIKTKVVVIPGNHDSNDRLGFARPLLKNSGLYIYTELDDTTTPVVINDDFGSVNIYPFPFYQPLFIKEALRDESVVDYESAFTALINKLNINDKERNIAVVHAFIKGGTATDDSELPLSVGGTEEVSVSCFNCFNYTALGHLHKYQKSGDCAYYSGSPLKYSFAEVTHEKCILSGTIDKNGDIEIKNISLKPLRDMRIIEGCLDEIIERAKDEENKNDYIKVILKDDGAVFSPMERLRSYYPNIIDFEFAKFNISSNGAVRGVGRDRNELCMTDIFARFYEEMTQSEFSDVHKEIFDTLYSEFSASEEK